MARLVSFGASNQTGAPPLAVELQKSVFVCVWRPGEPLEARGALRLALDDRLLANECRPPAKSTLAGWLPGRLID